MILHASELATELMGRGTRVLTMQYVAISSSTLLNCGYASRNMVLRNTKWRLHSGSDALVGCSTGVITDGLAEALFILHQ